MPAAGAAHVAKDAFDVALAHLRVRAASASEIARGVALQREVGAKVSEQLSRFASERHKGYCMRHSHSFGDCERSFVGSWDLGLGYEKGMYGLDDCVARCQSCKNCNFVSFSHAHHSCEWSSVCQLDELHRSFGGTSYRTRQVREPPKPERPPVARACNVSLTKQRSSIRCRRETYSFGCISPVSMWAADGCRGIFDLNGTSLPCESIGAAVTMCKPHGPHGHHAAMHAASRGKHNASASARRAPTK